MSLFFSQLQPPPFTTPDNVEYTLALSAATIVLWTSTTSLHCIGLVAVGGNVDGMVVVFQNTNTSAFTLTVSSDSGAAIPAHRLRGAANSDVTISQFGAAWFRYHGILQRWLHLGRTG